MNRNPQPFHSTLALRHIAPLAYLHAVRRELLNSSRSQRHRAPMLYARAFSEQKFVIRLFDLKRHDVMMSVFFE